MGNTSSGNGERDEKCKFGAQDAMYVPMVAQKFDFNEGYAQVAFFNPSR
jgi:hypothetical protein